MGPLALFWGLAMCFWQPIYPAETEQSPIPAGEDVVGFTTLLIIPDDLSLHPRIFVAKLNSGARAMKGVQNGNSSCHIQSA